MKECVRYRGDFLPSCLYNSFPHSSSSLHLQAPLPWFLPPTFLLCISQPLCPLLFIRQTWVREQEIALLFYEDVRLLGGPRVFLCPTRPRAHEKVLWDGSHTFEIEHTYVIHIWGLILLNFFSMNHFFVCGYRAIFVLCLKHTYYYIL